MAHGQNSILFSGGTVPEYAKFFGTYSGLRWKVLTCSPEVLRGLGPTRVTRDSSEKRLPPVWAHKYEDILTHRASGGEFLALANTTYFPADVGLPVPLSLMRTGKPDSFAVGRYTSKPEEALEAEFGLDHRLPALGPEVAIHPFFSNMRVFVKREANCDPELVWRSIAETVGARLVKSPKGELALEPNYSEVRKRATRTWSFFGEPNELSAEHLQLSFTTWSSMTELEFRHLVDAPRLPHLAELKSDSPYLAPALKRLQAMAKNLPPEAKAAIEAQAVKIELQYGPQLCIGFRAKLPGIVGYAYF